MLKIGEKVWVEAVVLGQTTETRYTVKIDGSPVSVEALDIKRACGHRPSDIGVEGYCLGCFAESR